MLWFAEKEFLEKRPLKNGGCLADGFKKYREVTKTAHPQEIMACPLPDELMYLWKWFWELSTSRRLGPSGAYLMLPATEIAAWMQISGNQLRHWEYKTLRALDALFLDAHAKELG